MKKRTVLNIVITGLFVALMGIMSFLLPNIGFIPLGVVSVSLVHLPVVVGAIVCGWKEGLILSLAFGLMSWIRSYMPMGAADVLFQNPLIAVLPRLMIGFSACGCFWIFKKLFETVQRSMTGKSNAFCHTIAYLVGTVMGFALAVAVYFSLINIAGMGNIGAVLLACVMGLFVGIALNNTLRDGMPNPNYSAAMFGCAGGALGNTVFTLISFYFFVPAFFEEVLVANGLVETEVFIKYLLGLAGTNGVLEMLVFALVGTPVVLALQKAYSKI
ncbi:MAG: ECF transporter S component [Clostridiales bacterium]|nr:ECF transporter S component [Clostridiales bacterium]